MQLSRDRRFHSQGVAIVIQRSGVPSIAWLVAVSTMVCFYLNANGVIPSNSWDYHGCPYLAGWVPATVLFSYMPQQVQEGQATPAFGIGKAWMAVGDYSISPGHLHYPAVTKDERQVSVYLDGRRIAQKLLRLIAVTVTEPGVQPLGRSHPVDEP